MRRFDPSTFRCLVRHHSCQHGAYKALITAYEPCSKPHQISMFFFSNEGRLEEGFQNLKKRDKGTGYTAYRELLQVSIKTKACIEGKTVHSHMIKTGFQPDVFIANDLINMYAKCGVMEPALHVFDKMPERNLVSWTLLVAGYSQNEHCKEALECFAQMMEANVKPDQFIIASVLKACSDLATLDQGEQVHAYIVQTGLKSDLFVGSALVDMYVKCGSLENAIQVFDKMPERNVVSWTTMITGHVQKGLDNEAFQLFHRMLMVGTRPNDFSFVSILKACANLTSVERGECIHACIIKCGYQSDSPVTGGLIDMYCKSGFIENARKVFDKMSNLDLVSWTEMITGYAQHGYSKEALAMYKQMHGAGMQLNQFAFASILSACVIPEALEWGMLIHAHIIKSGFDLDVFVGTAVIDMYAKCGSIENACRQFEKTLIRDMVSWTAIITGYSQKGHGKEALEFFGKMQRAGFEPNQFTFSSILGACAGLAVLEWGKQVHALVIKYRFQFDIFVGTALVDMYTKCGNIEGGLELFNRMPERNLVLWNAMISGYAREGQCEETLKLFCQMQWAGMEPNQFTLVSVSNACATLAALEKGKQVHARTIKSGFEMDIFVGSALVDMYAKCETVDESRSLFDKLADRNVVSWNAMITGYAQNGRGADALKLFYQMQQAAILPTEFTFSSVLGACASLAALEQGKQLHVHSIENGFDLDVSVGCGLVTMYAKCGNIDDALKVFEKMPEQDLVLWNAMIAGYAQHGYCKEALQLFEQMLQENMGPNHITFVSVLTACSHGGLLNEGICYFDAMSRTHGLTPKLEHYACMVDLFGRAGYLDKAYDFISQMPFDPGALPWRTLLGACRLHGNMGLGKIAVERLIELEPLDSATYVLLSNMYADAGRWNDVVKIRNVMKDKGVKKEPGRSWIEIKNRVHAFVVGDRSHPQTEEIYAKLEKLTQHMKESGYVPDTKCVLNDM